MLVSLRKDNEFIDKRLCRCTIKPNFLICNKKEKNSRSSLLYPLRLFLLCLVCKDSPIFGIWFGRGRAKMSHRQTSEKAQ